MVVPRIWEEVWIDQHGFLLSIEGCEHLTHTGDSHISRRKHSPLFCKKGVICNCSEQVSVAVVIQACHISLCYYVQSNGGDKSEESHCTAEYYFQNKAVHSNTSLQQNIRHKKQASNAGGIGEELHTCVGGKKKMAYHVELVTAGVVQII